MTSQRANDEMKMKVLIIDDSKAVRLYVEEVLCNAGYDVICAEDGYSGLECLGRHRPDVVLLDVEMPGISGLDVLERIQAEEHCYSVILFTTRSSLENRVQGLNLGADDYVVKPFEEDELLARVRAGARTASLKKHLTLEKNRANEALEELHRTQKRIVSEQKLMVVATLAAGMAHRINNPLGFIQSNLQVLLVYLRKLVEGADRMMQISLVLRDTECGFHEQIDEFLDWMIKAKFEFIKQDIGPLIEETRAGGERIAELVKSLQSLDLADKSRMMTQENLGSAMETLTSFYQANMPEGVTFIAELDRFDGDIRCNRGLLNVALDNIIRNALDSITGCGEIKLSLFESGSWGCIQIADTGCGIDPENLAKVYDPFFTTKSEPNRLGLGLTVTQNLIHAHGGKIEIDSEPGVGSSVLVALPIII